MRVTVEIIPNDYAGNIRRIAIAIQWVLRYERDTTTDNAEVEAKVEELIEGLRTNGDGS